MSCLPCMPPTAPVLGTSSLPWLSVNPLGCPWQEEEVPEKEPAGDKPCSKQPCMLGRL